MHITGFDHCTILVHHIDNDNIFLCIRFPQSSSNLLQIEHFGERRSCHNENSQFRIVPSFGDHITGTQKPDFLLLKICHNSRRILCLSGIAGCGDIGIVKQFCHLICMGNIDAKDDSLPSGRFSVSKIFLKDIDNQLIS